MEDEISFIHAADLHLDSPFQGLTQTPQHIFQEIRESTFKALTNLVNVAIEKEVDFVLLVGDLYDNERQTLKAQVHLRKAFEKLQAHHIKVYMSYGNHDHLSGNIHDVTYPDQVYVFPDEKIRQFIYKRDGKDMATIQGFSYENRAVMANKTAEYKEPLADVPFHIAMLHGNLQGNQNHDPYAPFRINDLLKKDIDYWALGHIHQRQILKEDPLIVYPGNTQGRHRHEDGPKGCYYVKLTKQNSEILFIPLHVIAFTTIEVDISSCQDLHQLEIKIQQKLQQLGDDSRPQLVYLSMSTDNKDHDSWDSKHYLAEMVELVNESHTQTKDWVYIYRYSFQRSAVVEHWPEGDHFLGELTKSFKESSIQPYLTELYDHRQGRKFLEQLTEAEAEHIKAKAYQLLTHKIFKNGRR